MLIVVVVLVVGVAVFQHILNLLKDDTQYDRWTLNI